MTQSLAHDHEDNKRTARLVSLPCVISLKKPQGRAGSVTQRHAGRGHMGSALLHASWLGRFQISARPPGGAAVRAPAAPGDCEDHLSARVSAVRRAISHHRRRRSRAMDKARPLEHLVVEI